MRAAVTIALVALLVPAAARGSDVRLWLGTDLAIGAAAAQEQAELRGLVAGELGVLPWTVPIDSRLGVSFGGGAQVGFDGALFAALLPRVATTDRLDELRHPLYLQAGPMVRYGRVGFEAQVGTDWSFGAVYASVFRRPLEETGHETVVLVGGRISLLALLVFTSWRVGT